VRPARDARGRHGSHEEQSAPTIHEQVRSREAVCDSWTGIVVENRAGFFSVSMALPHSVARQRWMTCPAVPIGPAPTAVSPGPVEVIPRVSERAMLWLAQGIKDDALEPPHCEGVFQESPEVCFVQSRNKFPDRFFLKFKPVSLRGGITQNCK